MKEMEDFIVKMLKDVNDLLYGKAEEPKTEECPSDEFGNTWQSRARRLQEDRRRLRADLDDALARIHSLEVDLMQTSGERAYYKARVEVLNAEVERLQEEPGKPENVPHAVGEEITVEPAPWSFTRLMDMDGDLWVQRTTINGRLWHCETVDYVQPLSFEDLKQTYGPLHFPPLRTK